MIQPYYQDDHCTIYHGESLGVMMSMARTTRFDVMLTDPPYSSGGMFRSDRTRNTRDKYTVPGGGGGADFRAVDYGDFSGDSRDQRSWAGWVAAWSAGALQLMRPGGYGFIFSDWRQLPAATDAAQWGGWSWRGLVVWDKGQDRGLPVRGLYRSNVEYVVYATHGAIDADDRSNVTEFPGSLVSTPIRSGGKNRAHPTEKPVELLQHILGVVPNTWAPLTVFDPFMGSGSTLVAAKYAGHKAVGIEIDERYCEIAANRLAQEVLPL